MMCSDDPPCHVLRVGAILIHQDFGHTFTEVSFLCEASLKQRTKGRRDIIMKSLRGQDEAGMLANY
jgi:hypothetical protein